MAEGATVEADKEATKSEPVIKLGLGAEVQSEEPFKLSISTGVPTKAVAGVVADERLKLAREPLTPDTSTVCTASKETLDSLKSLNISQATKDRLEALQCIDGEEGFLRHGATGEHVKVIQTLINEQRKKLGKELIAVNGVLDEEIVKEYQRDSGLKADGILGPRTWRSLTGTLGSEHKNFFGFRQLTQAEFLELTSGVDADGQGSGRVVPFNNYGGNPTGSVNQYRINQKYSWNCGPTAHGIVFAPFLAKEGEDVKQVAEKLADGFTAMQGGGSMSWANPYKFAEAVGMECVDLGNASPKTIAAYKDRGYGVTASFNDIITKGGHITAIGDPIRDENGRLLGFVNDDPNGKNIGKGLGQLSAEEVERGGRQFWAFIPKGQLVTSTDHIPVKGNERITFYGYDNEETPDSNTKAGNTSMGAGTLRRNTFAASIDVERQLREAGATLGSNIELKASDGTTFVTQWTNRTGIEYNGKPITGRFDIYTPGKKGEGTPFKDGAKITSFRVLPTSGSDPSNT